MSKTTPLLRAHQQGPEMKPGGARSTIHDQDWTQAKRAAKGREWLAALFIMTPDTIDQSPAFEQRTGAMIGKSDKTRARMLTVQMQESRHQHQTRTEKRPIWQNYQNDRLAIAGR